MIVVSKLINCDTIFTVNSILLLFHYLKSQLFKKKKMKSLFKLSSIYSNYFSR